MTAHPVAGTRGIGRAIVAAFVEASYVVAFCARDPAGVAGTVAAFATQGAPVDGRPILVVDGGFSRAVSQRSTSRLSQFRPGLTSAQHRTVS